ncbi:MAG: hypothetical protein AAF604_05480 [Acidobacteriota bacterium]
MFEPDAVSARSPRRSSQHRNPLPRPAAAIIATALCLTALGASDPRVTERDPTPELDPPAPTPEADPPTLTPENDPPAQPPDDWALEETFDGDPASPSQALLPNHFDYVVTHRTHPKEQFTKEYRPFPGDHDLTCAGPNPEVSPLPQHAIRTKQSSNGRDRDESFFLCKNHMMTALGEVDPYSLSAFWPKQEFDFANGGTLEFEVNINLGHDNRSWWEVLIAPRDQLRVAAGPVDAAIDEKYPHDRIVFDFNRLIRRIKVGTGALAPEGWRANERQFLTYDWAYWNALHPDDPALTDRRIRRTMRITLETDRVTWAIETADGDFDEWSVDVPGGLPFTRGLVLFKTHAYTPEFSAGNTDTYTFHWDNIRFSGPRVGRYEVFEASDVVYLEADGNRPIGTTETVQIDLPRVGPNPVLYGQLHQPLTGQVLLSINDGPNLVVDPYEYDRDNGCWSRDWKSFRLELDPDWLRAGSNDLRWTIGPRPACATTYWAWDGFSVKFLQVQLDAAGGVFEDGFESGSTSAWSATTP